MSEAVVLPLRERGMRWVLVGASVMVHAAAFFLLRVTGEVDLPAFVERMQVRAVVPSLERSSRYASAAQVWELLDSSLMALPSGPGFSGKLWGRAVPAARQVAAWEGGPAYLEPGKPRSFPDWVKPPVLEEAVRAELAREAEPVVEAPAPPGPGGQRLATSLWRITGELADRVVLRSPTVPAIVSPVALRPTQVRVAVAADGAVRYVALDRGCGNEAVDARAMGWARELRFAPVAGDSEALEWGVVRFYWATELPGNGVAEP
jgi:hypothetical protein